MNTVRFEKVNGVLHAKSLMLALSLLANGVYSITIKKVRKPRSNDQNGYLWGCVYPLILRGLINAGWEFTCNEQVHEYFKKLFTSEQVINRDTGEIIEFPASTALMDTFTFKTYTDKLREYAFEYLGMDIPEPDKYWKLHEKRT